MQNIPHSVYQNVFIALGSNLSEPVTQVLQAFDEIAQLPDTNLLKRSSLYKTAPVGRLDQPDFINAVAQIETTINPHNLLTALLDIEHQHKRVRTKINAPRTLDLDILLYGELQCQEPGLTLPHPRISERAFVLMPLLEICPDCIIPGLGSAKDYLTHCTDQGIEKLVIHQC